MHGIKDYFHRKLRFDIAAGFIVFLIAIPLCLGVALISHVPLYSGIISGIIGGIVIGFFSPSSISISGPTAGMIAIVILAMQTLGSFQTLLLSLFFAGCLQYIAGIQRLGFFADYIPASVVKGMMSAIGLVLIIKQIPLAFTLSHNLPSFNHLLMNASKDSNFHPLMNLSFHINTGACFLTIITLSILFYFDNKPIRFLPSTIIALIIGTLLNDWLLWNKSFFAQHGTHLLNMPDIDSFQELWGHLLTPNWSAWKEPKVYLFAIIFSSMASLESLININASERLDNKHRLINKNTELKAQGLGNILAGLLGGMPITAAVIRTSLNIESQAQTKMATIFHGLFLLLSIFILSEILNHVPLSVLASILIYTGYKLTQPKLFLSIYQQGQERFVPFIMTILGVVLYNLPVGVFLGLSINLVYILKYNSRARIDIIQEAYPSGITNRLILPQQTTFLNKASIIAELNAIPKKSQLIIDARHAEFIDKEIIEYIQDFKNEQAPLRKISLNLIGFKDHYDIHDHIDFINVSTFDAQSVLSPIQVLDILKQGNIRFMKDQCIHRSNMIDIQYTSHTQHPIAVVLGCIDSRVPVETIFDMTFGDLFCIRIAGNVINNDILASIEYACHVIGAKLIVVLGHTKCGAIQAACNHIQEGHITELLQKIHPAIHAENQTHHERHGHNPTFVNHVTELNIAHSMLEIFQKSPILHSLINQQKIGLVGALYNVETGKVHFSNYELECGHFNLKLPKTII